MGRTDRNRRASSSAAKPKTTSARFIDPMLLLRTESLPSGDQWVYELKLDGYRAIAFKTNGAIHLRSRNDNDFTARYPAVVEALAKLPDDTVIDGEIVAFDQEGRPSFNVLQNYGSARAPVVYYVFDLMVLAGHNLMREPLQKRRELLEKRVLPKLPPRWTAENRQFVDSAKPAISPASGRDSVSSTSFLPRCANRPAASCASSSARI